MKGTVFFGIVLLATGARCTRLTSIVQTDKGPVQGVREKTVFNQKEFSAFKGIPYAKPPVGDLRFKDPIEADPWTDVINGTEEAPLCLQSLLFGPIGNEDCLTLNVYTPVVDLDNIGELKAVMFWIFGGAFELGMTLQSLYGPDWFIEDDVVMVGINYRLGAFGFLSLGLPDASGNQGLKDQLLALQWVQRNIAKFGGDPNRVTIMGESAGAASVMYHVLSPRSAGMFQQAISESGTSLCPWAYRTPTDSILTARAFGASLGLVFPTNEEVLAGLKQIDAATLVKKSGIFAAIGALIPGIVIPWAPTYEINSPNAFLDDCPVSYLESGNFNKVPIMMGYNQNETVLFAEFGEFLRAELFAVLKGIDRFSYGLSEPLTDVEKEIANGTEEELLELGNALMFDGPIDLTQKLLAQHNGENPIYYYRFSWDTKHNWHRLLEPRLGGAAHTDEVPLLFHVSILNPVDPDSLYNVYAKRVVSLWTNFVKHGNPTAPENTVSNANWVPSGEEGLQIDIRNEVFEMHDRLLKPEHLPIQEAFHAVVPLMTECKSVLTNPSLWNPSGAVPAAAGLDVVPTIAKPPVGESSVLGPSGVDPSLLTPSVVEPSAVESSIVKSPVV